MDSGDRIPADDETADPLQHLLEQAPTPDASLPWEVPPDLPEFAWDEAAEPPPSLDQPEAPARDNTLLACASDLPERGEPALPAGVQHLIFTLAGIEYAVDLGGVRAIDYPPPVTPLPHVPDWLLGVGNLRGDVVSVVDLRGFLGLERTPSDRSCRLLVVRSRQDGLTAGLLVDGVREVFHLSSDDITAPKDAFAEPAQAYLGGVVPRGGGLLRVLDLESLLGSPQMRQFEPA
jgi:purine-binding chemotaxis protein CheW